MTIRSPFKAPVVFLSFQQFTDIDQVLEYAKREGLVNFNAWRDPQGFYVGRGYKMLKTFKSFVQRVASLLPKTMPDKLMWVESEDPEAEGNVWTASNNDGGVFVVHSDPGGPICLEIDEEGGVIHMHLSSNTIEQAKMYAEEFYSQRVRASR